MLSDLVLFMGHVSRQVPIAPIATLSVVGPGQGPASGPSPPYILPHCRGELVGTVAFSFVRETLTKLTGSDKHAFCTQVNLACPSACSEGIPVKTTKC